MFHVCQESSNSATCWSSAQAAQILPIPNAWKEELLQLHPTLLTSRSVLAEKFPQFERWMAGFLKMINILKDQLLPGKQATSSWDSMQYRV